MHTRLPTLTFLLASAGTLFAQTAQSAASGTIQVTDPIGAVIPNAEISVAAPDGSPSIHLNTDRTGQTPFALNPGSYEFTVSAPGFETLRMSHIQVAAGADNRVTAKLSIGAVGCMPCVVAGPPALPLVAIPPLTALIESQPLKGNLNLHSRKMPFRK